jgi:predicted enzyme related to lactoylglutathione lyase
MSESPKIRHLAIMSLDPERLAKFYESAFAMKRLPRAGANGSKAVFLTDGYLTLAILHNRADGRPTGLNHFGFQVAEQDEIAERVGDAGGFRPAKRPADRAFAESRGADPDGNNFDISVRGYDI